MKLILILLLSISLYAKNDIYFFPQDANKASDDIAKLINESKTSIDIAMYNFKYNKFAKLLQKAKDRGVKVKIFYTKKDIDFKDIKAIAVKDRKLHTKIAIFDKKIVAFGSPNWKKKSFTKNYEVLYITDDKKLLLEFNKFYKMLENTY